MTPVEIKVDVPGRPYSVWVGAGILERAAEFLPIPEAAEMAFLVADELAARYHGERAAAGLAPAGLRLEREILPGGEAAKTLGCAEGVLRRLARAGAHRDDLVAALGGGATGDLAGFVAAAYHRGVPFAQLPTTLLAMVDASIGGKTAVNLPEGKNLVGAFHQPVGVVADVTTLATLAAEEFTSGLAEVAKHGLISDPEILGMLARDRAAIAAREPDTLTHLVVRAAAVKARVVAEDETERSTRAHLNYGHTLGHALEALGGYARWRHGEAVAIGMVFAAHLSRLLGNPDFVSEHLASIEASGLPVRGADAPIDLVLEAMRRDKKYRGGLRFVVLEQIGRPVLASGVPEELIRRAYEEVRA